MLSQQTAHCDGQIAGDCVETLGGYNLTTRLFVAWWNAADRATVWT